MSLARLLFDDGEEHAPPADAPLVYVGDELATRRDVRARADALVGALGEAGVGRGEVVGVMLPNGLGPVAALFGVWRAEAVYLPLNPRLTDAEVAAVLDAVAPAAIVTDREHLPRFSGRPVLVEAPAGGPYEVVDAGMRPDPPPSVHDPDVALIQFTSGTTGKPKPVLLLHSGVLTLLDGVLQTLRSKQSASARGEVMPNLIPVSLSLWAGLYNVLFAMRVGAPVVVMDHFDTAEFARLVALHGIRSTVLPPAAMTMLTDDTAVADLAPLRFVRSITAPLSPFQARRFKDRFGIAVLNSYGQTEIGGEIVGWSAADSREYGDTKLGSVGRPHAGVELRVVDDDGSPLAPDTVGELQVQTPAMSAGYADGRDLSDRLTDDGWFRTGDLARVDGDGFLWIEGRASEMINRGGLKIHPGDVEEVLRASPTVADVAVVGVPDDRLGEVPWAFVVARVGAAVEPRELEDRCRAHLAGYKCPVRFVEVASLPRNEVGKVLTRALVEQAEVRS